MTAPAPLPMLRSRLWRKQALVISALVASALAGLGATEMWTGYREVRARVGELQQARASEVAAALRGALANVERHVQAVTSLPWADAGWLGLDTRREEYGRLLRLVPAVESVAWIDAGGRLQLEVSRREPDRLEGAPAQPPPPAPGAVGARIVDRDDHDPTLVVDLPFREPSAGGHSRVRIGLRALARELAGPLSPPDAEVYAVTAAGRLVLHRDPLRILARREVLPAAGAPAADAAAAGPAAEVTEGGLAVVARGLDGAEVLRSIEPVGALGWRVAVEQPLDLAMAPVWATLRRTAFFVALGLVLAVLAAASLAGRLTRPIRRLAQAAQSLRAGNLGVRVEAGSRDELAALAAGFNEMAGSLQASYEHLEERVAEKTRALEVADRHKSEFLASMSHELRTPLNAVIGFSEALQAQMFGPLNDKQREYVDDIHASGAHLLSLINDLLDLARIEAGRLELAPQRFVVGDALANALALVRERAHRQGLRLVNAPAPELQEAVADPRRFKQVLVNLLSNAVKFTPQGGEVKLTAGLSPAEGLWIEVADTGVGIAEEHQALVFEEFRQVGPDGERKAEGSGLGLPLVRRLVVLHGGRVTLWSRPGQGTRVRATFPQPPAEGAGAAA